MKLFIADTFWKSFIKLPSSVQSRYFDFIKSFQEDSRAAAIHLEPITQFKDGDLRTARVTDDYRAVMGTPDNKNYYCLFIGKHDVAYKWGMNKKIQWNKHTDSIQLIDVELIEDRVALSQENYNNPLPLSKFTDSQLLAIGVPEDLLPVVRKIKDLDDLESLEGRIPEEVYENIFALFDDVDIDIIINSTLLGKSGQNDIKENSANNRRHFVEITDDEVLKRMLDEGSEAWQIFLHPTQRDLVDADFAGTVKVSGSAGTGKTIAAIHRLKHLSSLTDSNVLFTTYTKALSENLEKMIEKMNIPKNKFKLMNVDKLLIYIARRYGIIDNQTKVLDYEAYDNQASLDLWEEVLDTEVSPFNANFLHDEYIDVIAYNNIKELKGYLNVLREGKTKSLSRKQRLEVWKLVEKYLELKRERKKVDRQELFNLVAERLKNEKDKPFTNVIVDEFQDFSNPELRFIRSLVKEGRNDIFLTGDPYQRIYSGRKINFSKAGLNVKGNRSRKLKVNYRTTEEIKKFAVAIVRKIKYDDLDGGEENNKGYVSMMRGDKPQYTVSDNTNKEVENAITFINKCIEDGVTLSDIAVAAPKRVLYDGVLKACHKEKLPYKEIKDGTEVGDKDGITFCTFHSLKGLEFRVMILVGVNESSMPSKPENLANVEQLDKMEKKEALSGLRSLLYVAITRGREKVLVSGSGSPSGLIEQI